MICPDCSFWFLFFVFAFLTHFGFPLKISYYALWLEYNHQLDCSLSFWINFLTVRAFLSWILIISCSCYFKRRLDSIFETCTCILHSVIWNSLLFQCCVLVLGPALLQLAYILWFCLICFALLNGALRFLLQWRSSFLLKRMLMLQLLRLISSPLTSSEQFDAISFVGWFPIPWWCFFSLYIVLVMNSNMYFEFLFLNKNCNRAVFSEYSLFSSNRLDWGEHGMRQT